MHTVEGHFDGRVPVIREIYDTILAAASEFGTVVEDPKKTSIHLNRKSAFAGVYTRREHVMLTLKSPTDIDDARIFRSVQGSARRWYLDIKITSVDEIDRQLLGWLRTSYEISG